MSRITQAHVIRAYIASRRNKHRADAEAVRQRRAAGDTSWTDALVIATHEMPDIELTDVLDHIDRYLAGDSSALL